MNNVLTATPTSLVGAAGEYFVLSQLCMRGYIAAPAPKGVPNVDIVVTDVEGRRLSAIQVKARLEKRRDNGWHMGAKHEQIESPLLFYCFVDLTEKTTWVIPSAVVARAVAVQHSTWLARPGKGGRAHNDSKMRRLAGDYAVYVGEDCGEYAAGWLDQYREAWHLLNRGGAQ